MRKNALPMIVIGALVALTACEKDEPKQHDPSAEPASVATDTESAATLDPVALAAAVGVEPGALEPPESAGAAAVATGQGELAVRRVGAESFTPASGEMMLWAGDQIRTGAGASATVVLADETVVELAEDSVLAIGDRNAGADPASSAALLYGVARFSVSDRGPGEGPFLVFTPGGVVATRGTTYGVGVAVDGSARVAVEDGEVDVASQADLNAPVVLAAAHEVTVPVAGKLAATTESSGDWGAWRDGVEAKADATAAARAHVAHLTAATAKVEADYKALDELAADVEGASSASAKLEADGDATGYAEASPSWGTAIEASFLVSLRLQQLTFAALSHAYLTHELYLRHPEKVESIYLPARGRVHAAVLYGKKFHGMAHLHLRPMRTGYYRHHPRGRAHAQLVGVELPAFYRAKLRPLPPAAVNARLKHASYRPNFKMKINAKKKVWVDAPGVGWRADAKIEPRAVKTGASWYVRPATPRAKVMLGAKAKRPAQPVFGLVKATPRANLKVQWRRAAASRGTAKRKGPKEAAAGVHAKSVAPRTRVDLRDKALANARAEANAKGKAEANAKGNAKRPTIDAKAKGQAAADTKAKPERRP